MKDWHTLTQWHNTYLEPDEDEDRCPCGEDYCCCEQEAEADHNG